MLDFKAGSACMQADLTPVLLLNVFFFLFRRSMRKMGELPTQPPSCLHSMRRTVVLGALMKAHGMTRAQSQRTKEMKQLLPPS